MYKIAVIGTGYVGITSAIGLASFGSNVRGLDIDVAKVARLNQGELPIYEPGMKESFDVNVNAGRLSFCSDIDAGIKWADIVFIGVGTPQGEDGRADLSAIFSVAEQLSHNINGYKIIITKSTVPVGTNEKIRDIIAKNNVLNCEFDVVSNPEFLREGKALYDFLHPDRVVIGVDNPRPLEAIRKIYRPLFLNEVPFVMTDLRTAEVIKYAANCFLATKIAFINEMARLCDTVGANVQTVAQAMGKDGRIGSKYLHPGPGYGGSCFPKDTHAIAVLAKDYNVDLAIVEATIASNELQKQYAARKIIDQFNGDLHGIKLAILGLAFKAETDDMRDSSAIIIINEVLKYGAEVVVYDPQAMENAKSLWGDSIQFAIDEYDAVKGTDGVVIITEWNQFRNMDIERIINSMRGEKFFDLRNIYKHNEVENYGALYIGMGI